uniref:Cytochrome b5 heme-binding domain-containing protein n=1 Tax=Oryza punctata TaxID=4537 RepID=A0A0E0JJX9_ORYPU
MAVASGVAHPPVPASGGAVCCHSNGGDGDGGFKSDDGGCDDDDSGGSGNSNGQVSSQSNDYLSLFRADGLPCTTHVERSSSLSLVLVTYQRWRMSMATRTCASALRPVSCALGSKDTLDGPPVIFRREEPVPWHKNSEQKRSFILVWADFHRGREKGKVYDVPAWLPHHPGSDLALLSLANQDVTDAFVAYHPASAWVVLGRYHVAHLSDFAVSDVSRDYRRLVAEFTTAGLFDSKGHGHLASLCTMAALLLAAVWLVLVTECVAVHMAVAVLLGFLWMQSGFHGHDSGHYCVMRSPALNRAVQVVAGNCAAGVSIGWLEAQPRRVQQP